MDHWAGEVIAFISASQGWAGPVVCALAFAESMVIVSLLVPFTAVIVASGALLGSGALDPWLILPWGILGATAGDAVSYWVGRYFGRRVHHIWPFRNDPVLLERGHRFFVRWGVLSVCLARFFGPLRAVVPLVAGMMAMPQARFQIANVASAIVWLPLLMLPGALAGQVFKDVANFGEKAFVYVFFVFLAFPFVIGLLVWLRKRRRV
ncbi:MAG: DedA family protein [Burkholderiales bacterium]|nr:DedA family protein [Burkholderiales bacterium]